MRHMSRPAALRGDDAHTAATDHAHRFLGWALPQLLGKFAGEHFNNIPFMLICEVCISEWLFTLDFGHSGIDPLQTRQERAGAVRKLGEVWWGGRHDEMTQPPMPLQ
jgi:hypothetical protein